MAETSTERFTRLLTLVPWLAAHSGVSKQDAARHFDLTVAQLESDLQLITFTGPGMYGGELVDIAFEDETVTVYDAQGLNRPLELSADEAAALLVGLHALQQLPDIDTGLIATVTEKLAAYAGASAALDVRVSGSPHAATISQALRAVCDLNILYVHPLRDDAASRRVTPISVITRDGVDYLNGWCRTSEAFRTFRLDRMHTCEMGEPSAAIPQSFSAAPTLGLAAIVELPVAAEHLLEQVTCTVLERGATVRARVAYGDERWLVAWVIRARGSITVLEPRPVADAIVQRAQSARDAYTVLS